VCPVCRGRGEVEAGISLGAIEYGPATMGYDWRGNFISTRQAYPAAYSVNPKAMITVKTGDPKKDRDDVHLLETNPFGALWGIAICGTCRGSGM
jgi:hypothetical protein